ncbi:hypothetical protein INT45_006687 [Circinella minor]|uniref:Uncharacterized protein n=1 Tax=Circinella minor TaxID=1195481 RepID=A0A8H7S323_9FUNG|nr:hypothetical protein INT45_006687 [Circinella minor]
MAFNNNNNNNNNNKDTTDELSSQLNAFSFSTSEEQLLKQLDSSTRINSVFQRPRHNQPESNAPINTTEWETPLRKIDNKTKEADEGWGDLPPAYTAISSNSMFGFNSIIETDIASSSSSSITTGKSTHQSIHPNSGFAKFQNTPVSFTSNIQQQDEQKDDNKKKE